MAKKKKKAEKPPREFTRRQISQLQRQRRRQRITFYGGISIIAAIILIVLIGWYIGEYRPLNQTVFAVGDTEFDAGYYINAIRIAGGDLSVEDLPSVANNIVREIEQNELVRRGALRLGISVSDDELKEPLKYSGVPINDASLDLARAGMLQNRLLSGYFKPQVPESDKQMHIMAMLLESESQAREVRERLLSGDNFTALAGEFALDYYAKNVNQGDYGWHPESIYDVQLGSTVAIEYAFSAEPETLSQPLYDEEAYKQLGYWLIKVLEKQYEDEAMIQAVFLSSEDEAEDIKSRLEAGEDLAALAEEYSQYSESKEKGGELGLVAQSDNISDAFNGYVFNPEVEIGVWSEPIQDDTYWTQGGYWLVKVIDKDDDREISTEDRDYLVNKLYNDWVSQLWLEYAAEIDETNLTPEIKQWAIQQAMNG